MSFNQNLWLSLPNGLRNVLDEASGRLDLNSIEEIGEGKVKLILGDERSILLKHTVTRIPTDRLKSYFDDEDLIFPQNITGTLSFEIEHEISQDEDGSSVDLHEVKHKSSCVFLQHNLEQNFPYDNEDELIDILRTYIEDNINEIIQSHCSSQQYIIMITITEGEYWLNCKFFKTEYETHEIICFY
jgi:hypothetical protein